MSNEKQKQVEVPEELFDQMMGFLVFVQESPEKILYALPKLRETASTLQERFKAIRGPWAICRLCSPNVRLKVEDFDKHDREVHNVMRTPCFLPHPDKPELQCRLPRGHRGSHREMYTTWEGE